MAPPHPVLACHHGAVSQGLDEDNNPGRRHAAFSFILTSIRRYNDDSDAR
jgi:hypothetical protein